MNRRFGAPARATATLAVACVFVALTGRGEHLSAQSLVPRLGVGPLGPELVTPAIEQAIERGVQFLLSEREPEGHWKNSRSSSRSFPCANTALVGLALLANGSTPTRGPHARVVSEITDKLLSYSTGNGVFEAPRGEYRPMYSHAFALTFLASVYGQEGGGERRRRIQIALRRGIDLCRSTQTDDGGWGYHPNYTEDEGTLAVTQLMGLRACKEAGLAVSKSMIDRAVQFIRDSKRSDGMVRYRVNDPDVRRGVTCAAVVALWHAGEYDSPMMRQIRDRVLSDIARESPHQWIGWDHGEYVEYYLAQVMWIQGGELWKQHYRGISSFLVTNQEQDGSWYGRDSRRYGEIYSTAIALLILQLPYKRLPVYQR